MKLYYSPGACSLAAHIVAHEAGLELELIKVDIPTKKTAAGDDYWAINPKGYVPALVLDDGQVLTELAVICQYLADQQPESGLAPKFGSIERYHQMDAFNFVATEMHKQIGALFDPLMTPEMKVVQLGTIERRLTALNAMLEGKDYLMGAAFSAVDAYLFNVLNWSRIQKIDLSRWPNVGPFMKRVAARPHVQAAMRAEGLIR